MRKLIFRSVVFFLTVCCMYLVFSSSRSINAACGGTITCCTEKTLSCTWQDGSSCNDPSIPGCNCVSQCVSGSYQSDTCGDWYNDGGCYPPPLNCVMNQTGNCDTSGGGGGGGTPGSTATPVPSGPPAGDVCSGGNRCYNDWTCCDSGCAHTFEEGYNACAGGGGGAPPRNECTEATQCPDGKTCGAGTECNFSNNKWGCTAVAKCFDCSMSFNPAKLEVQTGTSTVVNVAVNNVKGGKFEDVTFKSSNTNVLTTNPAKDTSSPYQTTVNALSQGTINLTASGTISGNNNACSKSITAYVYDRYVTSWWRANKADVTTNGSLISIIPTTCNNNNNCILIKGSNPGVASYGTTYDFKEGPTLGTVSNQGWIVNTTYATKLYDYSYFEKMAPSTTVWNTLPSNAVAGAVLKNTGIKSPDGYYWFKAVGDMNITTSFNINNRKVILYVEGGDLTFSGNVDIDTIGSDFFMAVVGKAADGSKGNINLAPAVDKVEGIFVSDNSFNTGTGNVALLVKGSVVSWGGVALQRDLGPINNQTLPSEEFEFKPDLVIRYPQSLTNYDINWKEVVP